MSESAVMLLPQPDSPTIASVRPRSTLKLIPCNALSSPRLTKKLVCRFLTSSTATFSDPSAVD